MNPLIKSSRKPARAFTLIELLTVVAIIGILAGILIPTVGAALKSADKAKTKAQFAQYMTALAQYKAEYGYWPAVGQLQASGTADLSSDSKNFMIALTGRDPDSGSRDTTFNRKAIPFISFSESELQEGTNDQLVDAFGNPNIKIVVDHDGDGEVTVPNVNSSGTTIKAQVAIYVEEDASNPDYENVYTWN